MGVSQDTFYRYKKLKEEGVLEALREQSRRKPNLKNRVDVLTEKAVVNIATDSPAYAQVRVSNELRKKGVFVSPAGVRSICLRHNLETFKKPLKVLEKKKQNDLECGVNRDSISCLLRLTRRFLCRNYESCVFISKVSWILIQK